MPDLTDDHRLLIKSQSTGTHYRACMAELRHRGIDADRKRQMWDEIAEAILKDIKPMEDSTLTKLLSKRPK